jgi:hypothetical protein
VIVPVAASTIAPSPGSGLNENTPPVSPEIVAVAPSHVAVKTNDGSSKSKTVKVSILEDGHAPVVVYSIE